MEVVNNDLYIDPLTGLNNFFSFIESDFNQMFGEKGSVLIIDIGGFRGFNEKYGSNSGDLCLKYLADSINKILRKVMEAYAFRTHGDEFTLIFPKHEYSFVEEVCSSIRREFKTIRNNCGFYEVELHTLIINYNNSINSIDDYYLLLVHNPLIQQEKADDKFLGDRLLRHIIGGVTNRVRDTLSYYRDAYSFALVDDVSGLANHRAGKVYLESLLEGYKTNNSGFSVLFIDGDNLRRYNDISYDAGNEMIRKLGVIITSSVRSEDKVYRWLSGDEFLVVLKGVSGVPALKLANRIREAVQEQTREFTYPTTISVGVACYPSDGDNIQEIINRAERANALAKSSGKNKVIKWEETSVCR